MNILVISSLVLSLLILKAHAFTCPPSDAISPCTCDAVNPSITCQGTDITQETIDQAFAALRPANDADSDTWLKMDSFNLHGTELEILSETPFLKINFTVFNISNNPKLSNIDGEFGFLGSGERLWRIGATTLIANNCAFTSQTFAIISIFEKSVKNLYLRGNKIEKLYGTIFDGGLKRLTNLEVLDVRDNVIASIGGSQLKYNTRLLEIDLSGNRISELWNEAFKFMEPDVDFADRVLTINMDKNQLTDGNINYANAFQFIKRPTKLILSNNNFINLSSRNFLNYFFANRANELDVSGNMIICDDKMAWLKSVAELVQDRVKGLDCINDPGKTVFDSDLTCSC